MKKNLIIFLLFLFLSSCAAEKQQAIFETCPGVFFSKEHKIYVTSDESPLKIENISYRAELNNYFFNKECSVLNNVLTGNLSLLFVVKYAKFKSGGYSASILYSYIKSRR